MNRLLLIGRLGRDPETRYTADGKAVCNWSMAIDHGYGQKKSTFWIRCTAWSKTAEVVAEHVKKGHRLAVDGELVIREWEDKDGQKKLSTECNVQNVTFIEAKEKQETQAELPQTKGGVDELSEDIPF